LSEFEQAALDRYLNKRPLGAKGQYDTVHGAAMDAFVTSKQHGRELWNLHSNLDIPLAREASELTRVQTVVLQQLESYWGEKAQQEAKRKQKRGSRGL
jgi:hypothetical protein